MNIKDMIDEELNVQFVNKELAGMDAIKKQLDTVLQQNPLIAKAIAQPVSEIEKKINGLKFAIADYEKKKKGENQTGVGTQEKVVKTAAPATIPQKPNAPEITQATNTKPV